jgi:hypothetical protein
MTLRRGTVKVRLVRRTRRPKPLPGCHRSG